MSIRYATLHQAKREAKVQEVDEQDDAYLKDALYHVSARIDAEIERLTGLTLEFAPRRLHKTIATTPLRLTSFNRQPHRLLRLSQPLISAGFADSGDTVQDSPLAATATTVTVNDVDGVDVFGRLPRFAVGDHVQIGGEIMRVQAVDTATNILTVERGVKGTSAAAHAQNTSIRVAAIRTAAGYGLTEWDLQAATAAHHDYMRVPYNGETGNPALHLRMLDTSAHVWDDAAGVISIVGEWGWHSQFARAWQDSGDTVQSNPLNAADTVISVTDVNGAFDPTDTLRIKELPRFSPGQMLRIGDEYLDVIDTDGIANTLTVKRGIRGTAAQQHAQGTAIAIWQPDSVIVRAATKWVGFMYKRRGDFQRIEFDGVQLRTFPEDIPQEVANILTTFAQTLENS